MKAIQFLRQALSRLMFAGGFLFALTAKAAPTNSLPQFVPPKYSIAIMPFENKTGQTNWQHWSSSLGNFLSSALGEVSSIYVFGDNATDHAFHQLKISHKGRISSKSARKVGAFLHAQHVLCGNYDRHGKKWSVKVQLINIAAGKTSKEMKAESADWFDVRDELVGKILQQLQIAPSEKELVKMRRRSAHSMEVMELFSSTVANQKDMTLAEEEKIARQVIALDPEFPQGNLGLAMTLFSEGKFDECEKSARRATALMPDLAAPHIVLGVLFGMGMKITAAEHELLEAIRLAPYEMEALNRLAEFYLTQERDSEAAAIWEWVERLDPYSATAHAKLGRVYAYKGDLKKARAELAEAERLEPEDVGVEQDLCMGYKVLRDQARALEHAEKFLRLAKKSGMTDAWVKDFEKIRDGIQRRACLHFVEAVEPKIYTPGNLNEELRAQLNEEEIKLAINPLLSTEQMKAWAEEQTVGATNDFDKSKKLFDALARRVNFGPGGKHDARKVFADWKNPEVSFKCQELALFYVALARDIGLKAYVVSVERDTDDDTVLHACAGVFIDGKALLVDPSYEWFGVPHKKFKALNDLQFLAIYLAQLREMTTDHIALKIQPDLALAQFNLFFDLCQKGNLNDAIKELDKGLELDSKSGLSYLARGFWEYKNDRFQLAVRYFRKAMELERDAKPQFFLAESLAKQGRWNEAFDEFREYLSKWPDDENVPYAREAVQQISEHLQVR